MGIDQHVPGPYRKAEPVTRAALIGIFAGNLDLDGDVASPQAAECAMARAPPLPTPPGAKAPGPLLGVSEGPGLSWDEIQRPGTRIGSAA